MTDAATTSTLPAAGDEVEVLTGSHKGARGIVTDINPNPNWREDDEVWAELRRIGDEEYDTFAEIDDPANVRVVRLRADIPTPAAPTPEELRDYLANAAHGGMGAIDVTETDTGEGPGKFLLEGRSATGMPFSAIIEVQSIEPGRL